MTRKVTIGIWAISALITLFLPTFARAQDSGYVRRYAAHFAAFGSELSTTLPPAAGGAGGAVIYNKNFFTAGDINTLYVTISATGDVHLGARLMISCLVDGSPCNPNPGTATINGAPAGWVDVKRFANYNLYFAGFYIGDGGGGAGDVHDNAIHYTWCTPFDAKPGSHNVQVKMASASSPDTGSAGARVFLEQVHFYIDGSRVASDANRCVSDPVDSTVATSPSVTTAPDGTLIDTTLFVPFTGVTALQDTLHLP